MIGYKKKRGYWKAGYWSVLRKTFPVIDKEYIDKEQRIVPVATDVRDETNSMCTSTVEIDLLDKINSSVQTLLK